MGFLYFPYSGLVNAVAALAVGIFVLSKNFKSSLNRSYAIFAVSVTIWAFNYFIWLMSKEYTQALFFIRATMIGAILIPAAFLYFVTKFVETKRAWVHILNIVLIAIFVSFSYSPIYIQRVEHRLFFPFWPVPGWLFHFMLAYFVLELVYAHGILWNAWRHEDGAKKEQIKYVLFGIMTGFIGGCTNYFLWYNIPFPPYLNILVSGFVVFVAYAIVKHQLMNIEVLIKRSLIFASLFTVIFGVFVSITVLTQLLIAGGRLLGLAISSIIIIFTVRPLEDFLIRITDKYLFQKKYDPLQLLKTFSDTVLSSVLDQTAIIKTAVDLLIKALGLENFAIFLINKDGDKYEVAGSSGIDTAISFSGNSYLISYLNKTTSLIGRKKYESPELMQDMDMIKAELCIPLVFHKNLVGFLAFGKRKSGNDYTNEDIDVLVPLTRDIAIAVVYARLYEDVRQKDKLATLGTLVAGIKHEIGNPLSGILTSTQLFMKEMEGWDALGVSQKDRETRFRKTLEDVLEESRKISRITKKFTDFARPGDEGIKEKVDIADSIKNTLEILENELTLKHIKIEQKITSDAPSIFVDKDQIHQILFNLLRNAAQAIEMSHKSKEESRISIAVEKQVEGKVAIYISDTGCGIPEEKKIKIFEPFFTTKQKGKGTGLGLAIVRQLVGKNRGDISFTSKEGEGTTFTIVFPVANNE